MKELILTYFISSQKTGICKYKTSLQFKFNHEIIRKIGLIRSYNKNSLQITRIKQITRKKKR